MKYDDSFFSTLCFFAFILAVVGLFVLAHQRDTLKEQAVERGCAEWIVDTEGKTTWKWKDTNK